MGGGVGVGNGVDVGGGVAVSVGGGVAVGVSVGSGVGVNSVNSRVSPPQAAANEAMSIRRILNASNLAGITVAITVPRIHQSWISA